MKDLADQVWFLRHDLTPSAVAALKPNAKKLNERARELFSAVDVRSEKRTATSAPYARAEASGALAL
jgi:hypothetical protein